MKIIITVVDPASRTPHQIERNMDRGLGVGSTMVRFVESIMKYGLWEEDPTTLTWYAPNFIHSVTAEK